MGLTYRNPRLPESKDRLWLCQLLIVFALSETFVSHHTPVIHLGASPGPGSTESHETLAPPPVPGTSFFEQALVLLKLPMEEPCVEHVEILNLAVRLPASCPIRSLLTLIDKTFYSYSMNRKKTAYMYAGMSARTCSLLRLHQPSPQLSTLQQEHRKRLCWTSYCLDKMTSSELGILPSFQPGQIKIEFPEDHHLSPEDRDQFHNADFLRVRIQLTFFKAEADVFIDSWHSIRDEPPDVERRVKPILWKLESWLKELPPGMCFDCEMGMPDVMIQLVHMRSLASLYLRYYQVNALRRFPPTINFNLLICTAVSHPSLTAIIPQTNYIHHIGRAWSSERHLDTFQ